MKCKRPKKKPGFWLSGILGNAMRPTTAAEIMEASQRHAREDMLRAQLATRYGPPWAKKPAKSPEQLLREEYE